MSSQWAIRLALADAESLAPLRLTRGIEVAEKDSFIWVRGANDEKLERPLRALPADDKSLFLFLPLRIGWERTSRTILRIKTTNRAFVDLLPLPVGRGEGERPQPMLCINPNRPLGGRESNRSACDDG